MEKKPVKKVIKLSAETLHQLESKETTTVEMCTISIPSCCP
jgi:hypothetical protein